MSNAFKSKRGRQAQELCDSIGTMLFACEHCDAHPISPYRYVDRREGFEKIISATGTYVRRPNGGLVVVCEPCMSREV